MKYPINVDSNIRNAGKSSNSDKMTAFVLFSAIINFFIYYLLSTYLIQGLGIPSFVVILGQLILYILVCVSVFRFFILKEDSKMEEFENSKNSGLKKFYKLRDKEEFNRVNDVNIFEYTDGQYLLALTFKYGVNNDIRIANTRRVYTKLFDSLGRKDLEFRIYNTTERYEESKECSRMMSTISGVRDERLSKAMNAIAEVSLEYSNMYSDLFETVIFIKTTKAWQFQLIQSILTELVEMMGKSEHSIRYIEFLDKNKIREFLKTYYQVETFDLANLKYTEIDSNLLMKYRGVVKEFTGLNLNSGGVRID